MEEIFNRVFGFLPTKSTFWSAFAMLVIMFAIQRFFDWIEKKVELPWMKEENQHLRKVLEKQKNIKGK